MDSKQGRNEVSGWKFAVRALRSRNFRLFFFGQGLSVIGTWMTRIATSWLVYRLTGSSVLLGTIAFASQIPILFLSPIAGVWVDRLDRHRVLIVAQVLAMLQSFALAAMTFSGHISIPWLIGLCAFQGLVDSFETPTRHSFVVEMVDSRDDLANGIALNSSLMNGARLIGPAIAGMIIAATSESFCYLIDGFSYIAVIVSLLAMRINRKERAPRSGSVVSELLDGWNYIKQSQTISSILLIVATVNLLGTPCTVLMPIFAGKLLHGGPNTLGWLMGAMGIGTFASTISLAVRKSVLGLGTVIVISTTAFGASLVAFSFSRYLWLSFFFLVITGFGMIRQLGAGNIIAQTIVPNEKRGRVVSFFNVSVLGVAPLGSIAAGFLASRIGAPATLAICGSLALIGAILFRTRLPHMKEEVHPIYRDLGILPIIAPELQTAVSPEQ